MTYQYLKIFISAPLQDLAYGTALKLLSHAVCMKMVTLFLNLTTSSASPSLFMMDAVWFYANIDLLMGIHAEVKIYLLIT